MSRLPTMLRFRRDRGAESDAALLTEIDGLVRANRERRDPELERRLLMLRYRAGVRLIETPDADPSFASPDYGSLPDGGRPPEATPAELTPELLRAAILRHGCLLVRGLLASEQATAFAAEIERALASRNGGDEDRDYYEEFAPDPPFRGPVGRPWVTEMGSIWAADSPPLMFELLEIFERSGVRDLVAGYLGERGVLSVEKCTLRKAEPTSPSAWHQDGKFLGDVRALNVWVSLSRCGDEAPGLDIVADRIDHVAPTGTPGAMFDWSVSPSVAAELAGERGVARPIFDPGDALLFDELCLHQSAVDPRMSRPRYAIESWFFGASSFPETYVPLRF